MTNPEQVYIIVPAYNEEKVIVEVVRQLISTGHTILIVDDASTDNTWQKIQSLPVHKLRHDENKGGGAAIVTGINFSLAEGAKFLVTFDADGQHDVNDIPPMLAPLYDNSADVTLGSRFVAEGKAIDISLVRLAILRLAALLSLFFSGTAVSDPLNGLRGLNAKAATAMSLEQEREIFAYEFVAQIRANRLRMKEVPVSVSYSEYSLSKGVRNSDALRLFLKLLVWRLSYRP